jgi:uncharacterized protein YbjQ (UPF0145 family)
VSWVVTCSECGKSAVYQSGQGIPEVCPACSEEGKREARIFLEKERKRKKILSAGSFDLGQRKIKDTLGLVYHEQIVGMNLPVDPALQKFNGGIALVWMENVREAREACIRAIEDEAVERGGNAVVGMDLSYGVLGTHKDMVMILLAARGTAVVAE